jgi:hypothetical protein
MTTGVSENTCTVNFHLGWSQTEDKNLKDKVNRKDDVIYCPIPPTFIFPCLKCKLQPLEQHCFLKEIEKIPKVSYKLTFPT